MSKAQVRRGSGSSRHTAVAPGVVRTRNSAPEPTVADLNGIIDELKQSWTARLTVRRQSRDDVGQRQIYVSLDREPFAVLHNREEVSREIKPGPHRLTFNNTLFWKTLEFTLAVGEHASFMVTNRAGFATYSVLAYFLGTCPLYLGVEREEFYGRAG